MDQQCPRVFSTVKQAKQQNTMQRKMLVSQSSTMLVYNVCFVAIFFLFDFKGNVIEGWAYSSIQQSTEQKASV